MLSRELWKDAEDVAGDIAGGAVTVPIRIGVRKTILLGFGFLAGAVLASFIPAFWWGPWYLGGIGLVDLFILATGVRALSCRDAACLRGSRVTTLVKYSMFASLAVFTLAAVLL
jgi:geranylgeranylglycerol-phosphate geranylgeranyltransferase